MKKWFRVLANNPVESTIFILSVGILISGVWIGWGELAPSAPVNIVFDQSVLEYIVATVLMCSAVPGILAILFANRSSLSLRLLRIGSFSLFMTWLFIALLRILVVGWTPITWLPTLLISLTCGVLRLYLGTRKL